MNEIENYRVMAGPTRVLVEITAAAGHRLQLISDRPGGLLLGEEVTVTADGSPVLLELGGLPDEACVVPLAVRIWPEGQMLQSRVAGLGEVALPDVLTLFAEITKDAEDVAAFRGAMRTVLEKYVAPEQLGAAIGEFVGAVAALNVTRIERERWRTLVAMTAEITRQADERIRLIG